MLLPSRLLTSFLAKESPMPIHRDRFLLCFWLCTSLMVACGDHSGHAVLETTGGEPASISRADVAG